MFGVKRSLAHLKQPFLDILDVANSATFEMLLTELDSVLFMKDEGESEEEVK